MYPHLSHSLHEAARLHHHWLLREASHARLVRQAGESRRAVVSRSARASLRTRLAAALYGLAAWLDDQGALGTVGTVAAGGRAVRSAAGL